jgi:PAS domain S-box-containing protein
MNDELLELLALRELGLADEADTLRLQQLLTASGGPGSPSADMQEVSDFLAETVVSSVGPAEPSVLLKERVMVATEPALARVVTDAACGILSISPAFTDLCGYTLDEVRGRSPGSFLQGVETDPLAVEKFRTALHAQEPCEVEIVNYHKCGTPYRVHIQMRPVFAPDGTSLQGYTAIETKIS